MYSTRMNESTGKDIQIYAAFFFFSKKICYESSGIMLKLADMDIYIHYSLGSLYIT